MNKFKLIDINQLLANLSAQIKQSNYVNRNIDKITKTRDYNDILQECITNHQSLNLVGLQNGLGALSHIIDHLGFNTEEQKLRTILLDRVDQLLHQPINVVCETYYNLCLLRGDSTKFAEKILTHISNEHSLPEACFMKVQRAINRKSKLQELDYELLQKLDTLPLLEFTSQAKAKIFRYFAEQYPLYSSPFYGFPKQMGIISKQLKSVPSPSIQDILCAYHNTFYEEEFLKGTINQFEKSIQEYHGLFNEEKFILCSQILRVATRLDEKYFQWGFYLNEFLYQLSQGKHVSTAKINHFCSIFINKIDNATEAQKNQIWFLLKRFMKHQPVWDFMNANRKLFSESIMAEFMQLFEKETMTYYNDYNQFAQIFNLPFKQPEHLTKGGLMILNYSIANHPTFGLKYLQSLKIIPAFWGNQMKVLLTSINNEATSQFWKEKTKIYRQTDYGTELQRQLNSNYYMYPKLFNYHQIEFVLWSLRELNLPPILVAPIFYRKAREYPEFIAEITDHIITTQLNYQEAAFIWEQLNYPQGLVEYLRKGSNYIERIQNKL